MSQASNRTIKRSQGRSLARHAGVLSAKHKNKLPKSDFGLPSSRKYPMPDKSHAANAKARATQMANLGKLSASSKAKIDAKANRILGGGKSND